MLLTGEAAQMTEAARGQARIELVNRRDDLNATRPLAGRGRCELGMILEKTEERVPRAASLFQRKRKWRKERSRNACTETFCSVSLSANWK